VLQRLKSCFLSKISAEQLRNWFNMRAFCADTPTRRYADTPIRRYADTGIRCGCGFPALCPYVQILFVFLCPGCHRPYQNQLPDPLAEVLVNHRDRSFLLCAATGQRPAFFMKNAPGGPKPLLWPRNLSRSEQLFGVSPADTRKIQTAFSGYRRIGHADRLCEPIQKWWILHLMQNPG
jgi:hypothetical protein